MSMLRSKCQTPPISVCCSAASKTHSSSFLLPFAWVSKLSSEKRSVLWTMLKISPESCYCSNIPVCLVCYIRHLKLGLDDHQRRTRTWTGQYSSTRVQAGLARVVLAPAACLRILYYKAQLLLSCIDRFELALSGYAPFPGYHPNGFSPQDEI